MTQNSISLHVSTLTHKHEVIFFNISSVMKCNILWYSTYFGSYLSQMLMDFAQIWIILKLFLTMVMITVRILEPVTIWEPHDRSGPWLLQTLRQCTIFVCVLQVFDGGYFRQDPVPFYSLVREIYPEVSGPRGHYEYFLSTDKQHLSLQRLCPTDTHKFFTLLHKVIW